MPGISWSTFNDGFTPAPVWRFNVSLPDATQIAGGTSSQQEPQEDGGGGARPLTIPGKNRSSSLGFLAQSFQLIHRSIETDQAFYQAHPRFFPSVINYEQLTVSFCETEVYEVAKFYSTWADKVVDEQGNFGLPKDYWQRIIIEPLKTTGDKAVTYEYEDCFPIRCEGGSMDGTSSQHVVSAITFAVNTIRRPR